MPFRKCNIQVNKSFGSCPKVVSHADEETGIIEERIEDCNKKLPDSENFEIQNQIAAGLNLKEVNTKIIGDKINEKELGEAITKIKNNKKNNNKED